MKSILNNPILVAVRACYQKTFLLLLAHIVIADIALADDVDLALPIAEVIIHPDMAIVTRSNHIQIPAGESVLVIAGLPQNLDPARLQISADSSGITLGSVDLKEVHLGELANDSEKRVQQELTILEDERRTLEDEIDNSKNVLTLLNHFSSGADSSKFKLNVDGNGIDTIVSGLLRNGGQARETIRTASIGLRQIDQKIEQKQFEKKQLGKNLRRESVVRVNVKSDSGYRGKFALSYPEFRAGWEWAYEARLNTKQKDLELFRQVIVTQSTGDDWEEVKLKVTTAPATEEAQLPELQSATVDIYPSVEEIVVTAQRSRGSLRNLPEFRANGEEIEEIVVTGSRIRNSQADIISSQYLLEFQIPGTVNVKSDGQEKILPIDVKQFDVDLVARTFPELDANAYLEARFTLEDSSPIGQGQLQMYRDGAYVGEGSLSSILPLEKASIAFGKDELVRVEMRLQPRETEKSRSFGRKNMEDIYYLIDITNFHQNAIPVEVIARTPVPLNGKVEVKLDKTTTPFDEHDIEGTTGINLWRLMAEPRQKATINYRLAIFYPQNTELEFDEGY